jgi:hypothetical protein
MKIKTFNFSTRLAISAFCLTVLFGILYAAMAISVSTSGEPVSMPSFEKIQQRYGGIEIVSSMKGSMYNEVSDDDSIDIVEMWVKAGAPESEYDEVIAPILASDCTSCHSKTSTMTDAIPSIPLTSYDEVLVVTARGQSWAKLVVETHTHLFAIGTVILALGILLSITNILSWIKITLILSAFAGLWGDAVLWTLAKFVGSAGYLIPLTGALMVGAMSITALVVLLSCWVKVPMISKDDSE